MSGVRQKVAITFLALAVSVGSVCADEVEQKKSPTNLVKGKIQKSDQLQKLARPVPIDERNSRLGAQNSKLSAGDWNKSFEATEPATDTAGGGTAGPVHAGSLFSNDSSSLFKKQAPDYGFASTPAARQLYASDNSKAGKRYALSADELRKLNDCDITVLIDCSGSMDTTDCYASGWVGETQLSRWEWCRQETANLTKDVTGALPSGINIVTFSDHADNYRNVSPREINRIFDYNMPHGGTKLDLALERALADAHSSSIIHRKKLLIGVITDGMPDQPHAVAQIIDSIPANSGVQIIFFLIGNDYAGTNFIAELSREFPIVSLHSYAEVCKFGLAPVLVHSIQHTDPRSLPSQVPKKTSTWNTTPFGKR